MASPVSIATSSSIDTSAGPLVVRRPPFTVENSLLSSSCSAHDRFCSRFANQLPPPSG